MPVRFVAHRCITDVSVDVQMSRTEERCEIGTELPARFPDRFMTAVAVHYAPNRGGIQHDIADARDNIEPDHT